MDDEIHSAHGQIKAVHQAHTTTLFQRLRSLTAFGRSFYNFRESFFRTSEIEPVSIRVRNIKIIKLFKRSSCYETFTFSIKFIFFFGNFFL